MIGDESPEVLAQLQSLFVVDKQTQQLNKISRSVKDVPKTSDSKFEQILVRNMYKTWEINQLKSISLERLPELIDKNEKPE